jgi:ABC-type uncharacterized transport system ATPase subunit
LRDIQEIANSVTIIKNGNIFSSGKVDELLLNLPKKAVLKVDSPQNVDAILTTLDVKSSELTGDRLIIYYDQPHREVMKVIVDNNHVLDFTFPDPSLEEYFLPIFQGN